MVPNLLFFSNFGTIIMILKMGKEIIGRSLEKQKLTEILSSHRSELVAVYGHATTAVMFNTKSVCL